VWGRLLALSIRFEDTAINKGQTMSAPTPHIQPYNASTDASAVFQLWQAALGEQWPISIDHLQQVLSASDTQHFVARAHNDDLIGFVATSQSQRQNERKGHILLLLVAPSYQRRGIGTALHDAALQHLHAAGLRSVQLGGLSPRFWCGVPTDLPTAQTFFQVSGWSFSETVYDLVQDLHHYTTPSAIYERTAAEQIAIEPASPLDEPAILAFEQLHFPNWLPHYKLAASLGDHQDLLVARDQRDNGIVGTTLLYNAQSHPDRAHVIWQSVLGDDLGALAAVGVASSERGRGIGIALVARASDLLKQRGARNCYIDWVVLTDFYARLGYYPWRSYLMSQRDL
jgi:beta-N-acetylhexosaminidase